MSQELNKVAWFIVKRNVHRKIYFTHFVIKEIVDIIRNFFESLFGFVENTLSFPKTFSCSFRLALSLALLSTLARLNQRNYFSLFTRSLANLVRRKEWANRENLFLFSVNNILFSPPSRKRMCESGAWLHDWDWFMIISQFSREIGLKWAWREEMEKPRKAPRASGFFYENIFISMNAEK